jgi:hypothetical protein
MGDHETMATSADPAALSAYSESALTLDDEIDRLATGVARAVGDFRDAGPAYGAAAGGGLGEQITTVANEQRFTDEWVGRVGFNFAIAGSLGLTGRALDTYITALSGASTVARSQALADARRVADILDERGAAHDEDLIAALARFRAQAGDAEYVVAFFTALGPEATAQLDEELAAAAERRGRWARPDVAAQAAARRDSVVDGYSLASRASGPGREGGNPAVGVLGPSFHAELVAAAGLGTLAQFTSRPGTGPMTDPILVDVGHSLAERGTAGGRYTEHPLVETILGNIAGTSDRAAARLLHDEAWSDWLLGGGTEEYGRGRGTAGTGTAALVEAALFDMPEGPTWAQQDFDRLVERYWHDEVPDALRVPLAAATGNFLPGMTERYAHHPDDITGFFSEITRDPEARAVLDVNLAGYTRMRLESGMAEVLAADYRSLPDIGRLGTEMDDISTLYGWVGDGVQEAEADQNAHAASLARALETVGGLASKAGVAATGWSGPVPAALGVGLNELAQLGADAVENAYDYDGRPPDDVVSGAVAGSIRPALVTSLYATPDMQGEDLRPLPPELTPPPVADAGAGQVQDYRRALDRWLGLEGNEPLRDQVDALENQMKVLILAEVDLD